MTNNPYTIYCNKCGSFRTLDIKECQYCLLPLTSITKTSLSPNIDNVNSPSHYSFSDLQPIDAIEKWELNFNLGNMVKYSVRAGRKNPDKHIEDLEKALYYLQREIKNIKEGKK